MADDQGREMEERREAAPPSELVGMQISHVAGKPPHDGEGNIREGMKNPNYQRKII